MKYLTFNHFDLIIVEDNENKIQKVIWKKKLSNEEFDSLDEALQIVNDNKQSLLHFKDNRDFIKELAQMKILHFPKENLKLSFMNIQEACIHIASQLL